VEESVTEFWKEYHKNDMLLSILLIRRHTIELFFYKSVTNIHWS
jgi:hypothetical protein